MVYGDTMGCDDFLDLRGIRLVSIFNPYATDVEGNIHFPVRGLHTLPFRVQAFRSRGEHTRDFGLLDRLGDLRAVERRALGDLDRLGDLRDLDRLGLLAFLGDLRDLDRFGLLDRLGLLAFLGDRFFIIFSVLFILWRYALKFADDLVASGCVFLKLLNNASSRLLIYI
jgi:hypothetical protein